MLDRDVEEVVVGSQCWVWGEYSGCWSSVGSAKFWFLTLNDCPDYGRIEEQI